MNKGQIKKELQKSKHVYIQSNDPRFNYGNNDVIPLHDHACDTANEQNTGKKRLQVRTHHCGRSRKEWNRTRAFSISYLC